MFLRKYTLIPKKFLNWLKKLRVFWIVSRNIFCCLCRKIQSKFFFVYENKKFVKYNIGRNHYLLVSEEESTWVCTSRETLPEASVLYVIVLVVFLMAVEVVASCGPEVNKNITKVLNKCKQICIYFFFLIKNLPGQSPCCWQR